MFFMNKNNNKMNMFRLPHIITKLLLTILTGKLKQVNSL